MRLAIIWTNSGQVYWRIHAHCRLNEVKWVKYSGLPRINSSLLYNKHVCRHSSWVASPKANLHVKAGLVQVVEWPRTGVKPLSEPMSTVFLRSNLSMSWIELPSLYNRHGLLCINKCVYFESYFNGYVLMISIIICFRWPHSCINMMSINYYYYY